MVWSSIPRCSHWLTIGIVALLIDLVLGIAATALEFQDWGEEGVTPDVVFAYIAIVPQILIVPLISCWLGRVLIEDSG